VNRRDAFTTAEAGRPARRAAGLALALTLVISQSAAGVTWHDEVQVDAFAYTRQKSLAVTGIQRVHLFYGRQHETIGGAYEVVYRRSGDGGLTWKDAVPLSPETQDARPLAIKRFGQAALDVLWTNSVGAAPIEVWYRRSLNNGFHWDDAIQIGSGQIVYNADVARFGDRVTIVYTNAGRGTIDVLISLDGGETFGSPTTIGMTNDFSPGSTSAGHPTVIDKNGTISVAWWTHYQAAEAQLLVRRSTNAGATWRDPIVLKDVNSTGSRSPISLLGAGPLKIIIGYLVQENGVFRAAARTSLNAGKSWRPEFLVGGARSEEPIFAYGGGVLRAAYPTCTGTGCTARDVKFKTSEDFGATWSISSIVNPEDRQYLDPAGIGALGTGQSIVATAWFDFNTYVLTRTTAE
jgi:hypothetical protein